MLEKTFQLLVYSLPPPKIASFQRSACRCPELRYLNVNQCRVSEAGVASFLCYHPLLADLLYQVE